LKPRLRRAHRLRTSRGSRAAPTAETFRHRKVPCRSGFEAATAAHSPPANQSRLESRSYSRYVPASETAPCRSGFEAATATLTACEPVAAREPLLQQTRTGIETVPCRSGFEAATAAYLPPANQSRLESRSYSRNVPTSKQCLVGAALKPRPRRAHRLRTSRGSRAAPTAEAFRHRTAPCRSGFEAATATHLPPANQSRLESRSYSRYVRASGQRI
jgi:hypothetical protein